MANTKKKVDPGVTVGALSRALKGLPGSSRSGILRAVAAKRMPGPDMMRDRGWRRWSRKLAAEIVTARGRKVPKAWEVAA